MLNFKKIELEDIPVLKAFFDAYPNRQCDRTAGAIAMWRDVYYNYYAVTDGTIILSSKPENEYSFSYPIGKNPDAATGTLENFCREHMLPMRFFGISNDEKDRLLELYPDSEFHSDRDHSDYLYDKTAILTLVGKKYSTQRNHINKFKKLYDNWDFEKITEANIPEIIEFTKGFSFNSSKEGSSAEKELELCCEVLENYSAFGMFGGALRINGKIAGYSIGEIIGDTLFCHIEKADISYHGAYQMVTNQFLQMYAQGDEVKLVNREDDCGDEGLRKSKLSYNPVELLEKIEFIVNLK